METNEILTRIEYETFEVDSETVFEAILHPADIASVLVQLLEDIAADNEPSLSEQYTAPLYAISILAELGETDAHVPLLQLCRLPERRLNALFGNILDGELDRALAATCGGDISGIVELIEEPDACDDVRISGLRALVQLADSDDVSRESIVGNLRGLFRRMERTPGPVWEELVDSALFLAASELAPEVLLAWEDDLIERDWYEMDGQLECLRRSCIAVPSDDEEKDYESESDDFENFEE